ncbi:DsbA family oxidoreductase [Paenibacillus sp. GSMTC-2017]|uniref:DsbA family oxidoreductase n=1 Tax=Paenibacillus sp. GSMTC-2017 TaxID=2794350 RepID=UPI0018D60281|nr:DsbA family oxidoreductase [Paenibacillus sp. GSMTC-2017]MBH5317724.1 DsbA family oxidoreductase [Paenibacillus sp. GSMTC-2017]
MKVELWSDFVCPFCYIGKRKFESALSEFPHKDHVELEFKSFELDPNTDSSLNASVHEMLAKKYGMSIDQAKASSNNVAEQAAAVGLVFRFDGMLDLNTFDAHRLSQYAADQGKGAEMSERLLKAHFTDSDNISNHARLLELAVEVGLNREAVRQLLESTQYADKVREQEEEGSRLGIRGVPFFVIDRKYAVSGAQSPAVFLDTLNKAWEEKYPTLLQVDEANSDGICTDGICIPGKDKS